MKLLLFQMNSSSLAVETPVKVLIREKSQTPLKINREKRFSPCENLKQLLVQINRVHQYQFHCEFEFYELDKLDINQSDVREITNYLNHEKPDLPDMIIRIEDLAVNLDKFDSFQKCFVSEEFDVDPTYSCFIITILNYKKSFDLKIEQAVFELLKLSSGDTLCQECIMGNLVSDKVKMSQVNNLKIYGNILTAEVDELDLSDDSLNDRPYMSSTQATSDSTSDSSKAQLFPHNLAQVGCEKFNPFESSSEISSIVSISVSHNNPLNSTELFNPFSDTSSESDKDLNKNVVTKLLVCEHCEKSFSNSHNRKLHYIRENFLLNLNRLVIGWLLFYSSFAQI